MQKLHDRRYYRFREQFTALNLDRIESISLISAVATALFALLPHTILCLFFPQTKTGNTTSLLYLEASFSCCMFLYFTTSQWMKGESSIKKKDFLIKSFISVALLHGMLASLVVYNTPTAIPIFLLTCSALMAALYWSMRRMMVFVGFGELLFVALQYLLYDEFALLQSYLMGHLIFLCIFFFISRTILELKLRDFENAGRLEAQSEQLQAKNQRLRMTEHALTTFHRHNHHGIFRIEGNRGFAYANDAFAHMIGFASASELIKLGADFSFISRQELENIATKLNQQGYAAGLELEARRRDGSTIWIQINCSVRQDEASGELIYEGSAQDISYRKKALREALENAAKLEQAEKIANAGFYEIQIGSGRFTYSAGYSSILGISEKENINLNEHLQWIHADDQPMVRQVLLQSMMRGEDYTLNYRINAPNGEVRHLISKGKVMQNELGKDIKILGTVQDVTQLKQQQEALEQSQAIIRTAFDHNNHFAIYIFDRDYKLLEYNRVSSNRLKSWMGVELQKGMDIRTTINPLTAETFLPIFRKALAGEIIHLEHKIMHNTPHELWADIYVGPVRNAQKEIIGAILMAADIDQRKRNEELLRNLSLVASHTNNAVMISDRKHRVEWVNQAFEQNSGYQLAEIQGRFPKDFMVSEQTDQQTLAELNNCLRQGKSFSDEILLINRNGEHKWVQLNLNPVNNPKGKVEKFVSVYTDLSERKAFEQELRKAKEAAEHSAEIKEYFLSTVSHELRTPLNAVIGLAYHLLQNDPRPDQADDLSVLKFSAENLLNLINDILDLSKIEAGKVQIERMPFNLRDILNSLKHTFHPLTESKGLDFKLYLHDDVPHELVGDSVRLIQIITNLLSNAIKFTHQGSIQVEIKAKPLPQDRFELQIEVCDSGIGIPEDRLLSIFDKFEQASTTTNHTYGGTGLGLAITKQLVELQGGSIWVKSTVGKGSCFGFAIPYDKSNKTDLKPLAYTYGKEGHKDLSRMRVLMAEDNQINQAVAGKFLQSWGISFDIAQNGKEAVQMAREKEYDLILMDLQMPELDGFEATRQIRELPDMQHRQIPIIAITAAGTTGMEEKIKEAGLNDMVLKPFKPETLHYKLIQYCSHHSENSNSMHKLQNTPSTSSLDLSGVLEVAAGDKLFLQELVNLYIRQFTETPAEMHLAVQAQDRQQLRRIFHKLKPSIIMLKIEEMTILGENIHRELHDENLDLRLLLPQLEKYIGMMENIKLKLLELKQAKQPELNP